MSRVLTILEVSQKQMYIFSSNKLRDNISRSKKIAQITSVEYIHESAGLFGEGAAVFDEEKNLVYSGGGHTILEFESEEASRAVVKAYTRRVLTEIPDIEVFASHILYDEKETPGENVRKLIAGLEKKKSVRAASFHQGTFGIEAIDVNTGRPVRRDSPGKVMAADTKGTEVGEGEESREGKGTRHEKKADLLAEVPEGFALTATFEKLGGTKDETNFIAVIHIDGNAMGKRVEELSARFGPGEWEKYRENMRCFSQSIADDFGEAYRQMQDRLAKAVEERLSPILSLAYDNGSPCFPARLVIAEGDDICMVTEGRVGIECAAEFLNALGSRKNKVDGQGYAACAGVALVHQKYPFYRAYELAEELCSKAKSFGVTLGGPDEGAQLSSIDWHIEFGELQDSLDDTRKQYETADGNRLELRPYIVSGPQKLLEKEPVRLYSHFRTLMERLNAKEDAYGRGRLKELRQVMKRGERDLESYLVFHKIEELGRDAYYGVYEDIDISSQVPGSGNRLKGKTFFVTTDGKKRSLLFDAIEAMDTWLPLEGASE